MKVDVSFILRLASAFHSSMSQRNQRAGPCPHAFGYDPSFMVEGETAGHREECRSIRLTVRSNTPPASLVTTFRTGTSTSSRTLAGSPTTNEDF